MKKCNDCREGKRYKIYSCEKNRCKFLTVFPLQWRQKISALTVSDNLLIDPTSWDTHYKKSRGLICSWTRVLISHISHHKRLKTIHIAMKELHWKPEQLGKHHFSLHIHGNCTVQKRNCRAGGLLSTIFWAAEGILNCDTGNIICNEHLHYAIL